MKNSWRVILTFSQNSLGKQFRNDLMMLRGTAPLAKTKENKNKNKQKQTKTKTKNKQNKTKTKHTHTHTPTHPHPHPHTKTCFFSKLISTPF